MRAGFRIDADGTGCCSGYVQRLQDEERLQSCAWHCSGCFMGPAGPRTVPSSWYQTKGFASPTWSLSAGRGNPQQGAATLGAACLVPRLAILPISSAWPCDCRCCCWAPFLGVSSCISALSNIACGCPPSLPDPAAFCLFHLDWFLDWFL